MLAEKTGLGLSGNQLKLLAMVTMTLDHVGLILFPHLRWMRWVGRLAFPIFAYMIAEGCRYTRSRGRYLGQMAALALVCQVVYAVAMDSLYMCILVTFSLSVGLIFLLEHAKNRKTWLSCLAAAGALVAVLLLCQAVPYLLPATDFAIDYGFIGVILPVLIYFGRDPLERWFLAAAGLAALAWCSGGIQWLGLLALIPLAFYSGRRGKRPMKYLFYIYYPAHLVAIHLLSLVL